MWYRKRTDAEALYTAKQCGIELEFNAVGEVLHKDDLKEIRDNLFKVQQCTIDYLFEKTELYEKGL